MPFGGAATSLVSMVSQQSHWRLIFIAGGLAPLLLVPSLQRVLCESSEFERVALLAAAAGHSAARATGQRDGSRVRLAVSKDARFLTPSASLPMLPPGRPLPGPPGVVAPVPH
jgi:hypothetical protein